MNKIVLDLIECRATLYPAATDGSPLLDAPLWTGVEVEDFKLAEKWMKIKTHPTARAYPKNNPLVPEYEINLGRVWALQLSDLVGWQASEMRYVMDVVWQEEETFQWQRRIFYGVTISDRSLGNRDMAGGFTDDQIFDAEYFVATSGTGSVPSITSALPYTVWWVDASGRVLLYNYDSATHLFTAAASTTGRATVIYSGGLFAIQFADDASPVVRTVENTVTYRNNLNYRNSGQYGSLGLIVRGAVYSELPLPTNVPRLDFYYGQTRIASVTHDGLFDTQYVEGAPAAAAGRFALYAGTNLKATFAPGEIKATSFAME